MLYDVLRPPDGAILDASGTDRPIDTGPEERGEANEEHAQQRGGS